MLSNGRRLPLRVRVRLTLGRELQAFGPAQFVVQSERDRRSGRCGDEADREGERGRDGRGGGRVHDELLDDGVSGFAAV